MSKAGYGTPEQVLEMRTDLVLDALAYETFLNDYESEFIRLNTEKNK